MKKVDWDPAEQPQVGEMVTVSGNGWGCPDGMYRIVRGAAPHPEAGWYVRGLYVNGSRMDIYKDDYQWNIPAYCTKRSAFMVAARRACAETD